jgi:hypothetical protein
MTNQQHPITLPIEMVEQWADMLSSRLDHDVFSLAVQWGADQELEQCMELLEKWGFNTTTTRLRAARRPKPPSLKEQALEELEQLRGDANSMGMGFDAPAIRRALEALPE